MRRSGSIWFLTLLLTMLVSVPTLSSAATVAVFGDRFDLNVINNFYNSLPGTTSSILSGPLNSNNLSGVNLLWAVQPAASYTAAETTTMSNFLLGGGRIAFMGEHGQFAPNENDRITAAISLLGGNISIINNVIDPLFHDATVGNGQILSNPLTVGVNTYNYAAFAQLTLSGTAQTLMLGTDLTSIMMGYQNIGPGSIFVITDQNVWDNVASTGTNNNGIMFKNLLLGNTGAPPVNGVPEPASLTLMVSGLSGLAAWRMRKRA
ncbi:MAG: hypothetical protein M3Z35_15430 [Nitrospirota bacterium]|nr:hypothetical protein [Nitrospirota bacterium]